MKTATTAKLTIVKMDLKTNKNQEQSTYQKNEVLTADKDGVMVEQTTQKKE